MSDNEPFDAENYHIQRQLSGSLIFCCTFVLVSRSTTEFTIFCKESLMTQAKKLRNSFHEILFPAQNFLGTEHQLEIDTTELEASIVEQLIHLFANDGR